MKSLLLLFFIPLLFLPVANAQSLEIDYENCTVVSAPGMFYWPFEVITRHDPAIAQRITDKHVNNPSAQLAIGKPETTNPEEATWISFRSNTNATVTWEVQLDLEYLHESSENRDVIVEIYSNNMMVQKHNLFQTGKNFCIVYNLQVTNPPHNWTDDEIIAVSSELTKEQFAGIQKEISKSNVVVGDSSRFDNIQTLVLVGLAVAIVVGARRARDNIKSELALVRWEREQLEEARLSLNMNDDYRELKINEGIKKLEMVKTRTYAEVIDMVQTALSISMSKINDYFVPITDKADPYIVSEKLKPNLCENQNCKKVGMWHPNELCTDDYLALDPSDPNYMPTFVEYDLPDIPEPESPGIKNKIMNLSKKIPFVNKSEMTQEELTKQNILEQLEKFDSKHDKILELKKMWDARIKIIYDDKTGNVAKEVEIIREIWGELAK